MNLLTPRLVPALLVTLLMMTAVSRGVAPAIDDASNYATWPTGSNGGTGFQPWQLTNGSNSGFFIGSSGVIDTGSGTSFGIFANTGDTASAIRPFSPGGDSSSILEAGQCFSMAFANGTIQSGSGTVGFGLQNSSGANEMQLYFIGGQTDYTLDINSQQIDTGIGFTTAGLDITYIQNTGTAFTLDVTPVGGSTSVFNENVGAADISQVRIFNANAGPGSGANVYANSLQVIPEASTVGLLACGVGVLLVWKRNRRMARRA